MNKANDNPKAKISFLGMILRIGNILIIIALILSFLAIKISPASVWQLAFFGIIEPYLALTNLLFALYWIFRWKKFAMLPIVFAIIFYPLSSKSFNFKNHNGDKAENTFKVLTYNVLVFGRYPKIGEEKFGTIEPILNFVKEENPDIMCFQEFYSYRKDEKLNTIKRFAESIQAKGFVAERYNPNDVHYITLFSKYEIVHSGKLKMNEKKDLIFGIYADIKINNVLTRVYSVHLQSIKLNKQSVIFTDDYELNSEDDAKILAKEGKKIAGKMKNAYIKRSKQIEILKNHIQNSNMPVIVCGDFNDTPTSYAYSKLSENLDDSFLESGFGLGKTYNGPYPSFRIDYILHSHELQAFNHKVNKMDASDHFPIECLLSFKEN